MMDILRTENNAVLCIVFNPILPGGGGGGGCSAPSLRFSAHNSGKKRYINQIS